jgi:hypothetical protein
MSLPHLLRDQPIRAFALACVAATSVFLGYLALTLIDTLSSPTWCSTALQAERITQKDSFVGLTACVDLLKIQLQSLALNSQIVIGTFALCLGVLIVIVIAGAKLAGKLPGGGEIDVAPAAAADAVADAAVDKAEEIKAQ